MALEASKSINAGLGARSATFVAQMTSLPNHYNVFRALLLAEQWLSDIF